MNTKKINLKKTLQKVEKQLKDVISEEDLFSSDSDSNNYAGKFPKKDKLKKKKEEIDKESNW